MLIDLNTDQSVTAELTAIAELIREFPAGELDCSELHAYVRADSSSHSPEHSLIHFLETLPERPREQLARVLGDDKWGRLDTSLSSACRSVLNQHCSLTDDSAHQVISFIVRKKDWVLDYLKGEILADTVSEESTNQTPAKLSSKNIHNQIVDVHLNPLVTEILQSIDRPGDSLCLVSPTPYPFSASFDPTVTIDPSHLGRGVEVAELNDRFKTFSSSLAEGKISTVIVDCSGWHLDVKKDLAFLIESHLAEDGIIILLSESPHSMQLSPAGFQSAIGEVNLEMSAAALGSLFSRNISYCMQTTGVTAAYTDQDRQEVRELLLAKTNYPFSHCNPNIGHYINDSLFGRPGVSRLCYPYQVVVGQKISNGDSGIYIQDAQMTSPLAFTSDTEISQEQWRAFCKSKGGTRFLAWQNQSIKQGVRDSCEIFDEKIAISIADFDNPRFTSRVADIPVDNRDVAALQSQVNSHIALECWLQAAESVEKFENLFFQLHREDELLPLILKERFIQGHEPELISEILGLPENIVDCYISRIASITANRTYFRSLTAASAPPQYRMYRQIESWLTTPSTVDGALILSPLHNLCSGREQSVNNLHHASYVLSSLDDDAKSLEKQRVATKKDTEEEDDIVEESELRGSKVFSSKLDLLRAERQRLIDDDLSKISQVSPQVANTKAFQRQLQVLRGPGKWKRKNPDTLDKMLAEYGKFKLLSRKEEFEIAKAKKESWTNWRESLLQHPDIQLMVIKRFLALAAQEFIGVVKVTIKPARVEIPELKKRMSEHLPAIKAHEAALIAAKGDREQLLEIARKGIPVLEQFQLKYKEIRKIAEVIRHDLLEEAQMLLPMTSGEREAFLNRADELEAEFHFHKEVLVQHNMPWAINRAKRKQYRGLTLVELIQEANLGLMKGVHRFDPETAGGLKGYIKLSTYVMSWIDQSMTREIQNTGQAVRLPIHYRFLWRMANSARSELEASGQRATAENIATYLGLDIDEVRMIYPYLNRKVSLDRPVDQDEGAAVVDFMSSGRPDVEGQIDQRALKKLLIQYGMYLRPEARIVLNLREGLGVIECRGIDGETSWIEVPGLSHMTTTLESVGEGLDLTKERIRQIQDKALNDLKRFHQNEVMWKPRIDQELTGPQTLTNALRKTIGELNYNYERTYATLSQDTPVNIASFMVSHYRITEHDRKRTVILDTEQALSEIGFYWSSARKKWLFDSYF